MRPFDEIPLEEWRQVMDVNVASMFLTATAVVPVMREQGGGKIVNISSGTPFRGVPFLLHYVTCKGAIVAFTRALAKELGKDNVLVNCVAPGFTMSEGVRQNPEVVEKLRDVSVAARTIQRDQEPEDVVGAVVYLCGPQLRLRHRPDDRDRRRPVLPLILRLTQHPDGVTTEPGDRVVYDVERDEAHYGAAHVDGHALVWELTERPEATGCCAATASTSRPAASRTGTRIPAPACASCCRGGSGSRRRGTSHEYGPLEWWYETGPDPVFAAASETEETAFVRVLVLPAEWAGKRTIPTSIRPTRRSRSSSGRGSTSSSRCEPPRRQGPRRPARASMARTRLLRAGRELPRGARRAATTRRCG